VLSQARTQSLEQVFISIARDGELRDLSVSRE